MEKKHTLVDNAAEKRYELDLGDDIALAEYVLGRGLIVLTHTEVPRSTKAGASARNWCRACWRTSAKRRSRSSPQCPFVAAYIRRHPEWMDLVLTAENK